MDELGDLFGWVGATVDGKYRVDAVVGQGGFGVVYRAHHLGFDQTVALKCLRLPQTLTAAERDRFRETFLSEGRLLHQLSRATAGIVQALDLGAAVSPQKHWTPYLVLEWLDGVPLDRDFLDRREAGAGGRSIPEAVQLLSSAARALAVAHNQGVAHRDIKPANLFLTKVAGKIVLKVLDFGIAKVMSESESVTRAFEETGASTQAFTARYGAPEQFSRRFGATGPWTDVFAFALVFVEAVTGQPALDGRDATQLFVASADTANRPTLRGHGYPAPDAVEEVLRRALAVDPRQRFAHAGEFWDALELAIGWADSTKLALLVTEEVALGSVLRKAAMPLGSNLATSPEIGPAPPTDLSSSRHLSTGAPARSEPSHSKLGRALVVGLAAVSFGALATVATRVYLHKPNEPAAPEATANQEPARKAPLPNVASISSREPAPQARSAVAAPESSVLVGVPQRDVPGGAVGNATIAPFRVLAREGSRGLDFHSAAKLCADAGVALCTDPQWTRACIQFPELAGMASWTSTVKGEALLVRGGQSCADEVSVKPAERSGERIGLCCERAIATTSENLQKQYLGTTAERVLVLERALNQRNVKALLELSEPSVVVDDQPKTQAELRGLIEADFRAAPELVVINDTCDIAVQAKKVFKGTGRRRKTVFHTQGWTAACHQTAMLPGNTTGREMLYTFSATSKLREISTKPRQDM